MTRYARDPYWITARRAGVCAQLVSLGDGQTMPCHCQIERGDRAFYYPSSRSLYALPCGHGEVAARDFASMAEDEAFMGGGCW